MSHQVPAITTGENHPAVTAAIESAKGYIGASMASNTQRSYRAQWEQFSTWCLAAGLQDLPAVPSTISTYFASMADLGKKASTIDAARAAIRKAHEAAGLDDPTAGGLVKQTLKGIRREKGTAPAQKAPILTADLRRLLAAIPDIKSNKGRPRHALCMLRDKALLLVGFATGSRRSELVSLQVEDLAESPEGIIITIRKSKTDQEGRGIEKGIRRGVHPDTCPVSALQSWLSAADITTGPVFRHIRKSGRLGEQLTAQTVALIVKEACTVAKLSKERFSGHSLRAGLVTQAAKNGASVSDIMRQTGHRSTETVTRYIRKANIFEDNVSGLVGL